MKKIGADGVMVQKLLLFAVFRSGLRPARVAHRHEADAGRVSRAARPLVQPACHEILICRSLLPVPAHPPDAAGRHGAAAAGGGGLRGAAPRRAHGNAQAHRMRHTTAMDSMFHAAQAGCGARALTCRCATTVPTAGSGAGGSTACPSHKSNWAALCCSATPPLPRPPSPGPPPAPRGEFVPAVAC